MKNMISAASPDEYVASLQGWQRDLVEKLRAAVRIKQLQETLKWGHLVYIGEGPVLLIRAEPHRVLFGFWRGKRLLNIEPRLKPGGKYEMATLEFNEGSTISSTLARRLANAAVELNETLGDPTKSVKTVRAKAVGKRAKKGRQA